jgi:hypothetical protein
MLASLATPAAVRASRALALMCFSLKLYGLMPTNRDAPAVLNLVAVELSFLSCCDAHHPNGIIQGLAGRSGTLSYPSTCVNGYVTRRDSIKRKRWHTQSEATPILVSLESRCRDGPGEGERESFDGDYNVGWLRKHHHFYTPIGKESHTTSALDGDDRMPRRSGLHMFLFSLQGFLVSYLEACLMPPAVNMSVCWLQRTKQSNLASLPF